MGNAGLQHHISRDPRCGQPVTGRTAPEAVSSCHLAPGPGRLLVKADMLYAVLQVPHTVFLVNPTTT